MKYATKIFLRNEVYDNEFRCPIVPNDVILLNNIGFDFIVESSLTRCFTDSEFLKAGAIVTNNDWTKHSDCLIIGIKELDNINKLNNHVHIYFSHSYKNQSGSDIILNSFKKSNSLLYDLEYFVDKFNKRIVAFGFYAGLIGTGLGLLQYLKKVNNKKLKKLKYWNSIQQIINDINDSGNTNNLNICIIGPNGRCGKGAKYLLDKLNVKYKTVGPSDDKSNLENFDIVINCICLINNVGTWYDTSTPFYKNTVIVDVSCDYTSPNNPIKIYNNKTTWEEPVFSYNEFVDIIAIDNLPSLLPFESSTEFSSVLTKLFDQYQNDSNKYWENNRKIFEEKINSI